MAGIFKKGFLNKRTKQITIALSRIEFKKHFPKLNLTKDTLFKMIPIKKLKGE